MILEQYYLGCLSQASYLIGDEETGTALVVDPRRDVEIYVEEAARRRLTIRHVALTHFHADFIAGHLELRERTGATIHLGRRAEADFEFQPLGDGDSIAFGLVRVEVLETPGHTPEGVSLVVYDLAEDARRPQAVLTGDTLFIGDVGRPDLMASVGVTAEELGRQLYHSIHEKLLPLPDSTLLYPGHGAGSMCGKSLSSDTVSTIGDQRRTNYALQPMDEAAFLEIVTSGQSEAPAYFSFDAQLNRKERGTLDAHLAEAVRPLTVEQVVERKNRGAQVLDTRSAEEFAAGHLAGSVHIGLDGKYATWAGTLLDPTTPLVLVTDPGREEESALRLGRIGFDSVVGYLEGGADALRQHSEFLGTTTRVDADQLARELETDAAPVVLDVRGPGERESSSIEDSMHIPLNRLDARLDEIPRDRRIALHCASGYRSSIAASLLLRAGWTDVEDLRGGIQAWNELQQAGEVTGTP